jgi:hypothetical protein
VGGFLHGYVSVVSRGINMAPFVETWPARELEFRSQASLRGNKRKGFDGELKGCELLEMLQYKCEVEKPVTKESVTRCWPIERIFRR